MTAHFFEKKICLSTCVEKEKKRAPIKLFIKWHQNTAFAIPNLESAARYKQAHE